jgi:glycosyltransferase involved in cell wall biosynthesis
MQVGVLPTLLNEYTRSMFPMKFYEFLAAGLPVVSTPLDFAKEPRAGLEVGGDLNAFVAAIEKQLARGKLSADEARAAVGDNTWERRLDKMLKITFAGHESNNDSAPRRGGAEIRT